MHDLLDFDFHIHRLKLKPSFVLRNDVDVDVHVYGNADVHQHVCEQQQPASSGGPRVSGHLAAC
ncbi:MAG: hypothetical protein M1829_004988 [Trizodia sp. TS-e1964]|nr:MAG: hypothetical protein M1829_004988 [Trizodia sp. TS-e1964]